MEKKITVSLRLTQAEYDQLKDAAQAHYWTPSHFVRMAMLLMLKYESDYLKPE